MKKFLLLFAVTCSSLLTIFCVLYIRSNYTKQKDVVKLNEQDERVINEHDEAIISKQEVKSKILVYSGDVDFKNTSWLERVLAFLNNSWDIAFDIPKDYEFEKKYIYGPITIKETVLTWCVDEYFFNDDNFKQYLDDSIGCEWRLRRWGEIDEMRWYSLTIPWGTYNAYIPTDQIITHCSITNPIVCWNENIDKDEVLEYYHEHNECPAWFGYYLPWVSWPTAYCYVYQWYCHNTTFDYVERNGKKNVWACDLDERVWCWYSDGPMVPIGDPCDFFKGMWILPADWSCW